MTMRPQSDADGGARSATGAHCRVWRVGLEGGPGLNVDSTSNFEDPKVKATWNFEGATVALFKICEREP